MNSVESSQPGSDFGDQKEADAHAAGPDLGVRGENVIAQPGQMTSKSRNTMLVSAATAVAILLLGIGFTVGWAVGSDFSIGFNGKDAEQTEAPFESATKKCRANTPYAVLGDNGKSLTLHGEGKERFGLPYTTVACILKELDVPDAIVAQMDSTRALDGRQQGEWGDIRASWTYHPDSGLQIILTFAN